MTDQTQTPVTEAPKAKRQMTFTVMDDGTVRADFPDSGLEPFSFSPASLPESLYPAAMIEGVISIMRSAMGKLSGEDRTAQAMRETLTARWETLQAGQWKIERTPGEGGVSYSVEVEAAFLFRQKRAAAKGEEFTGTLAEAAAQFAALDEAQVTKLKAVPLYKLAYAEVKAARATANAAKLAKKAAEAGDDDSGF